MVQPCMANDIVHALLTILGATISPGESLGPHNPSVQRLKCAQPSVTSNPVSTYDGNFWHTFDDLAIGGRGVPISLSHTYNSADADRDGPLGFGWSYTYGMSLRFADPSPDT